MRFALAALLLLSAAPALADEIGCEGVFNADTTLADLEAAFGQDNVVTGEVPGPEGTTMVATTIFPGDADREMQVRWWDETNASSFAGVTLAPTDTGPGGLKLGMGIEEVEAINGEPFGIMGFYWDYGGGASFDTGTLSDLPGGCHLGLRFSPTVEDLPEDQMMAISGDQFLSSSDVPMRAAKPVIEEINLSFPYPEEMEDQGAAAD